MDAQRLVARLPSDPVSVSSEDEAADPQTFARPPGFSRPSALTLSPNNGSSIAVSSPDPARYQVDPYSEPPQGGLTYSAQLFRSSSGHTNASSSTSQLHRSHSPGASSSALSDRTLSPPHAHDDPDPLEPHPEDDGVEFEDGEDLNTSFDSVSSLPALSRPSSSADPLPASPASDAMTGWLRVSCGAPTDPKKVYFVLRGLTLVGLASPRKNKPADMRHPKCVILLDNAIIRRIDPLMVPPLPAPFHPENSFIITTYIRTARTLQAIADQHHHASALSPFNTGLSSSTSVAADHSQHDFSDLVPVNSSDGIQQWYFKAPSAAVRDQWIRALQHEMAVPEVKRLFAALHMPIGADLSSPTGSTLRRATAGSDYLQHFLSADQRPDSKEAPIEAEFDCTRLIESIHDAHPALMDLLQMPYDKKAIFNHLTRMQDEAVALRNHRLTRASVSHIVQLRQEKEELKLSIKDVHRQLDVHRKALEQAQRELQAFRNYQGQMEAQSTVWLSNVYSLKQRFDSADPDRCSAATRKQLSIAGGVADSFRGSDSHPSAQRSGSSFFEEAATRRRPNSVSAAMLSRTQSSLLPQRSPSPDSLASSSFVPQSYQPLSLFEASAAQSNETVAPNRSHLLATAAAAGVDEMDLMQISTNAIEALIGDIERLQASLPISAAAPSSFKTADPSAPSAPRLPRVTSQPVAPSPSSASAALASPATVSPSKHSSGHHPGSFHSQTLRSAISPVAAAPAPPPPRAAGGKDRARVSTDFGSVPATSFLTPSAASAGPAPSPIAHSFMAPSPLEPPRPPSPAHSVASVTSTGSMGRFNRSATLADLRPIGKPSIETISEKLRETVSTIRHNRMPIDTPADAVYCALAILVANARLRINLNHKYQLIHRMTLDKDKAKKAGSGTLTPR